MVQQEIAFQVSRVKCVIRRRVLSRVLSSNALRRTSTSLISRATNTKRRTIAEARQCPVKKPQKDSLPLAVKEHIQKFYKRRTFYRKCQPNALQPDIPAFLMQISAYKIFRKENEDIKLGLSKLQTLRPERVKLLSLSHREFCLCPYCLNVKYKLLALNRVVSNSGIDSSLKIADEQEFNIDTLCPREGTYFHRYDCVFGKCSVCKDTIATIQHHYEAVLDITPLPVVTWNHWERSPVKDGRSSGSW